MNLLEKLYGPKEKQDEILKNYTEKISQLDAKIKENENKFNTI